MSAFHLATPLAAFVYNNAWFGVLITLHGLGAVIGLGPTFAYGILGRMAAANPQAGLHLTEAIEKIDWSLVNPILLTIQPLTGIGMIFNRGLNNGFFSAQRGWLIGGITAFLAATILALGVASPTAKRMISMMKSGQAGTPEFMALGKRMSMVGPTLALLGVTIIVLMMWKPGSGCLYQC